MEPQWLSWARRIQAMAQNGLTYTTNPYDIDRYHALQELAAEMMAAQTGADIEQVRGLFEREAGHATPKLDARGVVFNGEGILLVRELSDEGRWTLPGGWIDIGEPPSEAVEREVWEESGYRVRATKLLALYDRRLHDHPPHPNHIYKLFFHCELLGGAPSDSIETSDARFFPADALPALSVGRVTPAQIARFFEHKQHPDWPTDFD